MGKLKGKVAIVTGASKGIGAGIAEDLAREGASVVVNYSSSGEQAEAVVKKIQAEGGKAAAVRADVSKPAEAKKLVDSTVQKFGQVDILVNNAGVYEFQPLSNVSEAHFDRMFNLNVRGLLFTTQAAVNAFNGRGGSVINIGSVASQAAPPRASVYSATKGAVDVITKSLANELGAQKVRVNAALPGPVETEGTRDMPEFEEVVKQFVPRTPLGRVGQPDDIAKVVSFLASDDAGWVTGQIIPVAGGLS